MKLLFFYIIVFRVRENDTVFRYFNWNGVEKWDSSLPCSRSEWQYNLLLLLKRSGKEKTDVIPAQAGIQTL